MKALFGKIALFGALLLAAAAVSLLPSLAPPKAGATRETTDAGLPYDASYNVVSFADAVLVGGEYYIYFVL